MTNTLYFSRKQLLTPPTKRAAYSDRMAYVAAELSRLAYFPFEGGARLEKVIDHVNTALGDKEDKAEIIDRIRELLGQDRFDEKTSREEFKNLLLTGDFELVGKPFSNNDTEGFVCRRKNHNIAFLVYRGTESVKDVINDLEVLLTQEPFKEDDDSLVHKGFYSQFKSVDTEVKELLKQVSDCQLFITGHSLGGAIAVLATRFYAVDSSGACYTFGAPAVSNVAFQWPIKTPIYRIINEVDPVPRVPSIYTGFMVQILYQIVYKLGSLFGFGRSKMADKLIKDLKQYRQIGYAGYLMKEGDQIVMRVGSSLGIIDRFKLWFKQLRTKKGCLNIASFHKMDNYVSRLDDWAVSRNLSKK